MANGPQDADDQADSSATGAARHGIAEVRGQQQVPLSPLHEGRFGRMFRDPQPLKPDDGALTALAKLVKESGSAASGDNTKIPSGYTYLGQFVDHDITFDPMSRLQKDNDPDALVDFRTPRFDLDCLYGSGPDDDPFMYEWSSPSNRGVKLLVGRNPTANGAFDRDDLPRNQQGRALIGDPRNDENIIVSQLQLLMIRFHNKVVDRTRKNQKLEGQALFREAQRITRWHYQWIVVHDFLERIVGKETARAILIPGASPADPATTDIRFFDWQNNPFMPVEFSGAAYRYGHSQVRAAYDLNDIVVGVPIFTSADKPGPLEHLGGFRRLPALWTIDWSFYFKTSPSARPQLSRKIDARIAAPLFRLPGLPGKRPSLPLLNLRRGKALGLPSGQDIAAAVGAPPLTTAQLGLSRIDLPAAERAQLEAATPLWFYLLREAATLGSGQRLGMVGGRIVAEVLVGLLAGDPQSYLRRKPSWTPILPSAKRGEFTMPDLIKFTLG